MEDSLEQGIMDGLSGVGDSPCSLLANFFLCKDHLGVGRLWIENLFVSPGLSDVMMLVLSGHRLYDLEQARRLRVRPKVEYIPS
jgi:hypothetical protein